MNSDEKRLGLIIGIEEDEISTLGRSEELALQLANELQTSDELIIVGPSAADAPEGVKAPEATLLSMISIAVLSGSIDWLVKFLLEWIRRSTNRKISINTKRNDQDIKFVIKEDTSPEEIERVIGLLQEVSGARLRKGE